MTPGHVVARPASPGRTDRGLHLLRELGIGQHGFELFFKPIVDFGAVDEILELGTRLEQRGQGRYLVDDVLRAEVFQLVEAQLHGQVGAVVGHGVVDAECQARLHAAQDRIEIVPIDGHELAILQAAQRFGRFPRQVGNDAHHER